MAQYVPEPRIHVNVYEARIYCKTSDKVETVYATASTFHEAFKAVRRIAEPNRLVVSCKKFM